MSRFGKPFDPASGSLGVKLSWITVLYFAEGLPFGIAYDVWPVYYRVHGVSLKEIGLMALLFLPYTLKAAWAPFVDRFGSRQNWVTGCQICLAVLCFAMLALDPTRTDWILWLVLLSFTLFSATQDIAIDGYAVEISSPKDSGHINGFRVASYRGALIFAGGIMLLAADLPWFGWQGMWVMAGCLCLLFAVLAQMSPRVAREAPSEDSRDLEAEKRLLPYRIGLGLLTVVFLGVAKYSGWQGLWITICVVVGTLFIVSLLSPEMLRWAMRRDMVAVLLFGLLYKVGDSTLGRMVKPFWVDHGMTPTEIGLVSSTLGMALTIGGALLGGWFISKKGIFQGILWLGVAQIISNFGYVLVAMLDLPRGEMAFMGLTFGPFQASIYTASMVESVAQGLGTAALLSFLMNICDRKHAATQYALLSAAFSLSRDLAGSLSGIGVESLGYTNYFTLTAFLALPGMALIPFVRNRIREEPDPPPATASA